MRLSNFVANHPMCVFAVGPRIRVGGMRPMVFCGGVQCGEGCLRGSAEEGMSLLPPQAKPRCSQIWEFSGIFQEPHDEMFPACAIVPLKWKEMEEPRGTGKPLEDGTGEFGKPTLFLGV